MLADPPGGNPEVILIATGSEVCLAVDSHEQLLAEGIKSRVVSMPSWDIFEHQSKEYRESVLPPQVTARVAVEQGSTLGWERYVGPSGRVIGMKTFGPPPRSKSCKSISASSRASDDRRQGTARAEVRNGSVLFRPTTAPSSFSADRGGAFRCRRASRPSQSHRRFPGTAEFRALQAALVSLVRSSWSSLRSVRVFIFPTPASPTAVSDRISLVRPLNLATLAIPASVTAVPVIYVPSAQPGGRF